MGTPAIRAYEHTVRVRAVFFSLRTSTRMEHSIAFARTRTLTIYRISLRGQRNERMSQPH
eukprot:scaffold270317_cov31-Prasinocladus_malaysianus.AAC.1